MKLYKFIVWVCAGLLVLTMQGARAAEALGQDVKVQGNGAVSNFGSGAVEEKPDVTLDYRIAEADEMVSRSMIAATDMYKQGKITKEMWPCVKEKLNKAFSDIDNARNEYKAENHAVALFLTNMVEQNVSALNTDLQN